MIPGTISALIKRPSLFFKYLRRERNLANFLSLRRSEVKAYLEEADQITANLTELAENAGLGAMFSRLRGPIVYVCARVLQPTIMVETGVASGASTSYILHAMELNRKGRLYSIDFPNVSKWALVPKNKEVGWLVPLELRSRWKLILGRSQEKLALLLKELGGIDAFLHDSDHSYTTMNFEYETAWPYLSKGGILLSDDIHWNHAFDDFVMKKNSTSWIKFDGLGAIIV